MLFFPSRSTIPRSILIAIGMAASASAAPAYAGGITSPAGLTDAIDWSQLENGGDGTPLPSPQTVSSADGVVVTVSSAGGRLTPVVQGDFWKGNFTPGEAILWDGDFGPDITLTFTAPVDAAGATIQATFLGAFTAQVTVNGTETFTENGDSTRANDGSAIFIGWSGGPITTLEFELTSAQALPSDFAIGMVALSSSAPEPSTWAMMMLGFAGLGFAGLRTRKSAILVA